MSLYRSILNKIILKALPIQPAQSGLIQYDGCKFYLSEKGVVNRVISVSSDVVVEDTTVANTTEETTIFSATIQPETAGGKYYRIPMSGKLSCINAVHTITLRWKINGAVLSTVITPKVLSDDPLYATFFLTIRTPGESGSYAAGVQVAANNTNYDISPISGAFDSSIPHTLSVTAEWSNANVGNSISIVGGLLEDLY